MNKKRLWVIEDFYHKDLTEGDIVRRFEGNYKILNMNHINKYGEFILSEYIEKGKNSANNFQENGVLSNDENPYEIIGAIHVPGYQNLLAGIGYYLKNKLSNEIRGYSYQETWNYIFHQGATNATASKSQSGNFFSSLISTIDELPSLDSHYWKIPAFVSNGELFAPLSKHAEIALNKGLKYAVRNLTDKAVLNIKIENKTDKNKIVTLKEYIKQADKITVLSGAGISTLSGIPDYRSTVIGMWTKNPNVLMDLNESTFKKNPDLFWKTMYTLLKTSLYPIMPFNNHESLLAAIEGVGPNQGHQFFHRLEKDLKKEVSIITQNVDGLHQKAGNQHVLEFHGNIHECICPTCQRSYQLCKILKENETPQCECGGILRPNVVFFEDTVKEIEEAINKVKSADLVIVAGTSLTVYPFNQLLHNKMTTTKSVFLNAERIENDQDLFDLTLTGNISTICRRLQEELAV